MSIFKDLTQALIDRKNRKAFINDIKAEQNDPNSKFNIFQLAVDKKYKKISCLVNIGTDFQLAGTDKMIYGELIRLVSSVDRYLKIDLNWMEYLSIPQFIYLDDQDARKENKVSCTYVAIWDFITQSDDKPILKLFV